MNAKKITYNFLENINNKLLSINKKLILKKNIEKNCLRNIFPNNMQQFYENSCNEDITLAFLKYIELKVDQEQT